MRKIFTFLAMFLLTGISLYAQVGINADDLTPDPSAMLDVNSTSKGFLPPRMSTEQMNAITTPAVGLIVYNITVNSLFWFNGSTWMRFNDPYMETDPIFSAHAASGITIGNIGDWNAAYGWGNHALAGYLTNYIEIDPVFGTHPASSITLGDISNWNTAYGWGNHALAGYLTSFTETDPIFSTHPASGITAGNIGNWNTAYTNVITGASGTLPLNLSISGNQLSGSINTANSTTSGYLTSTDWNTFNNKQNALTFGDATSGDMTITGGNDAVVGSGMTMTVNKGNLTSSDMTISGGSGSVLGGGTTISINKGSLTEATSSVLNISGGTESVLGSGVTVQVKQAGPAQSGYLSAIDWTTFNNKQNLLTFGNLTSIDINVSNGTGAVKGTGTGLTIYKGSLTESGSSVLTITGGNAAVLGSGATIQVKQANTTQSGYLSSTDWNSFNNKVSSQWVTNGPDISYNIGKVGIGTTTPASSALVEMNSTTQGFLPPRMSMAQRDAIVSPAIGLIIYCLDCPVPNNLQVYIGSTWNPMAYNRYPYVTEVAQTGNATVGSVISGNYTYHDADNDPQGTSLYRWYRADNASGLNEAVIPGSTNQNYTLVADDTTKYIRFAVVPAAQSGATPGMQLKGAGFIGPVLLWNCGFSTFTINHVVGSVAPVTKTTTYGTVTNIPGEPTKCWITSNLGSDHQATAVDDATEASAGWYWQFNRKQGYKHDGTTRTPNTTWITSISETSDWITANDPCNIELGITWRLPTYTELNNVDNTGGWTNWNGPWGSGLKLHAAGYLTLSTGALVGRGSDGALVSNTQKDANTYWALSFYNVGSSVSFNNKAYPFSARCVRDN